MKHVFTLGIEEEFQIVDPETRELRSHIQQILADGKMILKERVKPEMHQSVVELGTEVCSDIRCARQQVVELRSELAALAGRDGLRIASAGTHPFSHWMDQLITEDERYATIVKDMQQIARANLIFGLHVHVGIPDREVAIAVMNQARYFLPHLYALSANSPFWLGQNTGLKAYRQMIFERFPRTGIPDAFESLSEYEDYLKLLVATGCIDDAKKIWWDIRLHPFFDTLEFRICDAQSRVDDTIALAALMQAIVVKLHKLLRQNVSFRMYPRRLIDENRWRASRYGLDCKLIDFGRKCEVDERELIHEMLDFIRPEMDDLGNHEEMAHIEKIMGEGTGADRQLAVWERTHDVRAVVDHIIAETYEGLTVHENAAQTRTNLVHEASDVTDESSRAGLAARLAAHPFLRAMNSHQFGLLAKCAIPAHFDAGQVIFDAGEPANGFYLIERGSVILEGVGDDQKPVTIDIVSAGEPLGWSWLFPPYLWQFTARAAERTTAICLAGTMLRQHRDEDLTLSHELFKRMSAVMVRRLQAARGKLI